MEALSLEYIVLQPYGKVHGVRMVLREWCESVAREYSVKESVIYHHHPPRCMLAPAPPPVHQAPAGTISINLECQNTKTRAAACRAHHVSHGLPPLTISNSCTSHRASLRTACELTRKQLIFTATCA